MASQKKTEPETKSEADNLYGRELARKMVEKDDLGLFKEVSYKFKDDGFVDWKAMLPKQFVVVNTEYFEKRNIEIPTSTEGLEDKQLLVLLGGFKELSKLRGVVSVTRDIIESGPERAVVKCKIVFSENYETRAGMPVVYEEVANATLGNTNSFSQLFLETIASNRAFVRAIRNALRIDIVGSDELSTLTYSNDNSESTSQVAPWMALVEAAKGYVGKSAPEGFKSFEEFKVFLTSRKIEGAEDWNDWKDIPVSMIWKFIGQLKKAR